MKKFGEKAVGRTDKSPDLRLTSRLAPRARAIHLRTSLPSAEPASMVVALRAVLCPLDRRKAMPVVERQETRQWHSHGRFRTRVFPRHRTVGRILPGANLGGLMGRQLARSHGQVRTRPRKNFERLYGPGTSSYDRIGVSG
jgi:hypothetical protein